MIKVRLLLTSKKKEHLLVADKTGANCLIVAACANYEADVRLILAACDRPETSFGDDRVLLEDVVRVMMVLLVGWW